MKRAVILWTGGKDSCLALHQVKEMYEVVALVVFTPPNPRFYAHPLPLLEKQSIYLGLPLWKMEIKGDARNGYETALRLIHDKHRIETLVTGDIGEVDGQPNWIRKCAEPLKLEVVTPLWDKPRREIWSEALYNRFRTIITYIKNGTLDLKWLGCEIKPELLGQFQSECAEAQVDLCGENGEFHTAVLNSVLFSKPIQILKAAPKAGNGFNYWDIDRLD